MLHIQLQWGFYLYFSMILSINQHWVFLNSSRTVWHSISQCVCVHNTREGERKREKERTRDGWFCNTFCSNKSHSKWTMHIPPKNVFCWLRMISTACTGFIAAAKQSQQTVPHSLSFDILTIQQIHNTPNQTTGEPMQGPWNYTHNTN